MSIYIETDGNPSTKRFYRGVYLRESWYWLEISAKSIAVIKIVSRNFLLGSFGQIRFFTSHPA